MSDALRHTFDTAAELYDRVRPGYPATLFRDLVALSGLPDGGNILEVGCGTGQATLPMAQRGYRILALDLGANMLAVARRKLAAYANVELVQGAFEQFAFEPTGFDLVMSATAWHWVDPAVRYRRAAAALRPGAAIGVIANTHIAGGDDDFWGEASQTLYWRYAPGIASDDPMPSAEQIIGQAGAELEGNDFFEAPLVRAYPWRASYDSGGYIDLLDTYSGHINLPAEARKQLYHAIAELIDTRYGGSITKGYLATLSVARTSDHAPRLPGLQWSNVH